MRLELTNTQLFSTVLYMRHRLHHSLNIGILLLTGATAIIANLAVLMMDKTVVNLNSTTNEKNINAVITEKLFLKQLEAKDYGFNAILTDITPIYIEELSSPLKIWLLYIT